jgi:hypothetical protein
MGKGFKECEGDLFIVGNFLDESNNLIEYSTMFLEHLHLSGLQIRGYQN